MQAFGTVTIGSKKYNIKRREQPLHSGEVGRIEYAKQEIIVGESITMKLDEVLLHEIVHGVLHSIKEHELNADEKFVSKFSKSLSKALKSLTLIQKE